MTNKEHYIERELVFANLNKLLILENPDFITLKLLKSYGLYETIDYIDLYLEDSSNVYFISYFPGIREKLISVLQIFIFCLKKVGANSPDYDDIIIEEEIDDLFMQIKKIENLDISKEEAEAELLSYRNINNEDRQLVSLKICYIADESVFRYINGKCDDLSLTDNNYIYYIYSLMYYHNMIGITLDDETALKRIGKIIFLSHPELTREQEKLYDLFFQTIPNNYLVSSDGYDYVAPYEEEKISCKKREKLPDNVIKMQDYLKKR